VNDWFAAKDDDGVLGRFVELPVIDKAASKEAGENRYKNALHVQLRGRGSNETAVYRVKPTPEGERIIQRFPEAYAAFQGEQVHVDGTPLTELPGLGPEKAGTWQIAGVRTIEELAEAGEHIINRLGFGARDFQKVAKMYVAETHKQEEPKPAPKRRGRPPKQRIEAAE